MGFKLGQRVIDTVRGKKDTSKSLDIAGLRNSVLSKYIDFEKTKGLEFGPLHCPQLDNKIFNVKYADLKSRKELVEDYKNTPDVQHENIPDIDFIIDAGFPSKSINEKFDYIIANHVIEHSPNPLLYLQELSKLLNDNGILFMAIPEKTLTFDKERPVTSFQHLMDDYFNNTDNKDFSHLFEFNKLVVCPNKPLKEVYLKTTEDIKKINDTSHIHFHVFTLDSFRDIIMQVIELDILNFELVYLDKPSSFIEFYLVMKKT